MNENLYRLIYQKDDQTLEFVYNQKKKILFAKSTTVMKSFDPSKGKFQSTPVNVINGYGKISSPLDLRELPYFPEFNELEGKIANFKLVNLINNTQINECVLGSFAAFANKKRYFTCQYNLGTVHKQFKRGELDVENNFGINLQAENFVKSFIGQSISPIKKIGKDHILYDECLANESSTLQKEQEKTL